ncbi:hypothetical protein Mapa_012624 [Marchantia paleacea]|nr:hypothetical protein Mapa_012624 [Marchantia paleacea]
MFCLSPEQKHFLDNTIQFSQGLCNPLGYKGERSPPKTRIKEKLINHSSFTL